MCCPGGRLRYSRRRDCKNDSLISGTKLSGFSIALAIFLSFSASLISKIGVRSAFFALH
ncbi:hypothetical protein BDQ94DRAFT_149319 [Aspergillus welwitschiae]|uniref:Uncharacterized protein n=1 Tax=Aspergillus welwitschiae TaxID=1341132 RepID=A0A3F3PTS6_9EURO|nr:hypothetical protein BDQ94DRAFT_149319 [Aspergillus welwitschiae]RDH30275.1 hypothetical protein BDQ94DRAFT_149319 [Aspergillus welwitschiae]